MAMLGLNAGTDLVVTIGTGTGLLYATDPHLEDYFQDKEGLRAKYGEIKDAGKAGWQEITHGTIRDAGMCPRDSNPRAVAEPQPCQS